MPMPTLKMLTKFYDPKTAVANFSGELTMTHEERDCLIESLLVAYFATYRDGDGDMRALAEDFADHDSPHNIIARLLYFMTGKSIPELQMEYGEEVEDDEPHVCGEGCTDREDTSLVDTTTGPWDVDPQSGGLLPVELRDIDDTPHPFTTLREHPVQPVTPDTAG